ncbi:hypothetical protein J6W34_00225 [bacterium]|nr:hypothetical protein [bacterium]
MLSCLHNGDGGTPNDISDVYPNRTNSSMRIYVRAGWSGYVWEVKGYIA